jgi:hypothetical protein
VRTRAWCARGKTTARARKVGSARRRVPSESTVVLSIPSLNAHPGARYLVNCVSWATTLCRPGQTCRDGGPVKGVGEGPGRGSRCAGDVVGVVTKSWPGGLRAGRHRCGRGEKSRPVAASWCGHGGAGGEKVGALGGEVGSCFLRNPLNRPTWSLQTSILRTWSRSGAARGSLW